MKSTPPSPTTGGSIQAYRRRRRVSSRSIRALQLPVQNDSSSITMVREPASQRARLDLHELIAILDQAITISSQFNIDEHSEKNTDKKDLQ
jgi:hypothetical protein